MKDATSYQDQIYMSARAWSLLKIWTKKEERRKGKRTGRGTIVERLILEEEAKKSEKVPA